jgi:hypothetical protein
MHVSITALDRDAAYQQSVLGIHAIDRCGAGLCCNLGEVLDPDIDGDRLALLCRTWHFAKCAILILVQPSLSHPAFGLRIPWAGLLSINPATPA